MPFLCNHPEPTNQWFIFLKICSLDTFCLPSLLGSEWGVGVSSFPHVGAPGTGVKNFAYHIPFPVSMPTQPHMGKAYTSHNQ